MSKKISPQELFDQVVDQVSVLTQASTPSQEDAAVEQLRLLAEASIPSHAKQVITGIADFRHGQKEWPTAGKKQFSLFLNTELPRLREAFGMARTNLADTIWKNAELLRGAFKEAEYRRVILPFTILRRLDCLLEPTKKAVLAKHKEIESKKYEPAMFLPNITGYSFWNHSNFTIRSLLESPDELRDNLENMVNGFSPNVCRIFEKFGFIATLDKLVDKGRLFLVAQAFSRVPMDTYSVSSHDMGRAFEELLRRFNDASPAGEQYTPRDAIHLMVDILFDGDEEMLSVPGVIRTMYDQTAGTGGMLSEADERVRELNPDAKLRLFGQELEDETYAICMADMLIRGQNPADIAPGDTLADDKHPDERFDYQLSNPPYGVEWKPSEEKVKAEYARGAAGRFAPGIPRINDGQMLFQLNALSKMRPYINGQGGGRVGLVHNGSPLFTGDAGGSESEIRRYILQHDYLDAIIALPTDMFYNTNISTYLWFMSNRKHKERQGKVLLVDATGMGNLMPKNLGKKRIELSEDCRAKIVEAYHNYKNISWSDHASPTTRKRALKAKVVPSNSFFYRKVTIEHPLRMRFVVDVTNIEQLRNDAAYKKLSDENILYDALKSITKKSNEVIYLDADRFRQAILDAELSNAKSAGRLPAKLKPKQFELARKFFGRRDRKAEITKNEKGEIISDADLRDAEYIPHDLLQGNIASGVTSYFKTHVEPHWPDAWVNETIRDEVDNEIGIVGCEINFNREFYVYQEPRGTEDIKREIEEMELEFMKLLKGVAS